jgi:hypothetical protein
MVDHTIDNLAAAIDAHFIIIDIEILGVVRVPFFGCAPRVERIGLYGCPCNGWRWRLPPLGNLDSARGNDSDVACVAALLGIQAERRRVMAMAVELTVA